MKKIVKGNDFTLRIPVMKMVEGEAQAFPLPACTDVIVQVCNQFRRIPLAYKIDVKEDNVLLARVEGDKMSIGTYAIEVKGKIFGNDWRSNEYPQFTIVANNADADTEFGTTDEGDNSVEMDTAMVILPPTVELSNLISQAEGLVDAAQKAADTASEASKNAKTALSAAENVNADLVDHVLTVTNRQGEVKSVNLGDIDEVVTVTITSSVESVKVGGISIAVRYNHGTTPQTFVTDGDGKAVFRVHRGEYYELSVPQYGNAQPISPVGFTAVLESRSINLSYLPYDEESSEKVVVTVTKYKADNQAAAYEGIPVSVTYDKKNVEYQSDSKGQVTVYVPYGKEYTVTVENQEGYYVSFNKNTRTYTATVPQRLLDYRMYQFKAGIFVVDDNLNEYYIDDWVATGRDSEEVMALKVADSTLMINKGTFMIRTSDLRNMSKLSKLPWCTQQLLFTSIASNGNVNSDANYYNGESSTFLIRQEAQERSLSVPAADYAYNQIFCIGGQDLRGFKMSAGQEFIHMANASPIKQILTTLYGEDVGNAYYKFVMNNWRWTSSQFGAGYAWVCSSSASSSNKTSSNVVLPVFACP